MKKNNLKSICKWLIMFFLLVIATCVDGYSEETQNTMPYIPAVRFYKGEGGIKYQCEEGYDFSVAYSKDREDILLYWGPYRRITRLYRVTSESGEKYISQNSPPKVTFWEKDKKVFFEVDGKIYKDCKTKDEHKPK